MILYSERQIDLIRQASRIVAECHHIIRGMVKPGATTRQIDQAVTAHIRKYGGTSPFYNYELPGKEPFPAWICASVNDVVVHGVPNDVPLEAGDLVSIDVGVRKDGYIGDSAWSYAVGAIDEAAQRLMRIGEESLYKGIEAMRPRGKLVDVSRAIQRHVEGHGYSVVREYVGHGVGQSLHEEPQVPNYVQPGQMIPFFREILKPGMCLAVEPMVNEGSPQVESTDGEWVVRTADGGRSVHFEHTVVVHADRIEILTDQTKVSL
ncbi:MAG: type I methionyl aminopeptidase [Planctomycetota bacterium]|nr:type I methionyl aminopeptidase [Planctomycetota bacterium]